MASATASLIKLGQGTGDTYCYDDVVLEQMTTLGAYVEVREDGGRTATIVFPSAMGRINFAQCVLLVRQLFLYEGSESEELNFEYRTGKENQPDVIVTVTIGLP